MTSQNRLTVSGISAITADAIQGTTASALVATGSTQGGALPLPADICKFGTVGSGTGALIPPSNSGDSGSVFNGGANALLLYPPVGGTINALSANAGYSIATATPYCSWECIDPLTFIACQSA